MKIDFIISVLVVFFLQTVQVSAQNYPYTKEKKVSGKFTVSGNDKLVIENKYGNVQINTWDKNEITVDITATARAKSEEKAQDLLDRITFVEETNVKETHRIYYKTVINKNQVGNINSEMEINYVVNMPKKNAVEITNKFGDVGIDDFEGDMRMDVSYGNLTTQKISGNKKYIKVGFGNASIASIDAGKLEMSYSNVTINSAKNIELKNEFGGSKVSSVQVLEIHQKYGDLEIGTVDQLTGSVGFADIDIEKLTKKADLDLEYCGTADFGNIDAGVEMIDIKASFSDLIFKMEKANLSIDATVKFGDMDNDAKTVELSESTNKNDKFSSGYKGKAGKGEGTMTLNVNYGDVNFD